MNTHTTTMILFAIFALGLPIWLMGANKFDYPDNHGCSGECYEEWKAETGGAIAMAKAAAQASPLEKGKQLYNGCVACHGSQGEGGLGPALVGQSADDIVSKLAAYRAGETRGAQSNLMWGQAAPLSDVDLDNLAQYITSF